MAVDNAKIQEPWWLAGRMQVCTVGAIAVLFLVLLIHAFHMAYRAGGYDFTTYLLAGRCLWEGHNPYQAELPFPYIYPLFLAFVLIPLAFGPYWLANAVWFLLSAASLVIACVSIERLASGESRNTDRYLAAAGLITMFLLFSPIQCGMAEGQVNPLVLVCCTMFYASYTRNRPLPAGAWLGAAIAIKVLPAVLLVFLVARRKYRILLWTLLFTALFCLLPVVIVGKNLLAYYHSYLDVFLWPSMAHTAANSRTHFSFAASVGCFFPAVPSLWLKIVTGSIVMAGLAAVEMTAPRSDRPCLDIWCFCGYLVGCLALSPVVELHHFVLAAPAVFLLTVRTLADRSWTTRAVAWSMGAFVTFFDVIAERDQTKLSYFVGLVILLAVLVLANRHQQVALEGREEDGRLLPA